jgi:hypothetical protein
MLKHEVHEGTKRRALHHAIRLLLLQKKRKTGLAQAELQYLTSCSSWLRALRGESPLAAQKKTPLMRISGVNFMKRTVWSGCF